MTQRYVLDPPGDTLQWLLGRDACPQPLPFFPNTEDRGLVCAQLVSGRVSAEVVISAEHLAAVVRDKLPMGRLYFQIDKAALYSVCPALIPE